jgi:alpha-galactosidase
VAYKISIIGGGSSMFTPQLISLFIQSKSLKGSTVSLMDINPHRLELMEILGKQLVEKTGADLKIESTCDRRESLTGADFVITSISVGGFDAWEKDLEIPAKYGIYVPFGDSIGPGGILRAFRHIPPMVQMCKELETVSPNAWVLNYTNPATALCWVMLRESKIKVVSLCTNTTYLRDPKFIASWVGVEPDNVVVPPPAAGINHCAGLLEIRLRDGRDAFQLIKQKNRHPVIRWGLDTYGILPYAWPHWQEFYPAICKLEGEYKGRVQGLPLSYGIPVKDMQVELKRVRQWEDLVTKWVKGEGEVSLQAIPKTEPLQLVEVMEALIEDKKEVHVVNVRNNGAIDNLPAEAVVEVSALVSGQGIQPIHVGPMPKAIAVFLSLHLAVEELTLEAGLTGDRRLALQAFELDPFISAKLTLPETRQLLDEMLTAHAANLPQFQ